MGIDKEKIEYFLYMMYPVMELQVEQVLNDSEADPDYSAIAAANTIKCYIQIMTDLGNPLKFDSVEGFFKVNGFTNEEYRVFEDKRKKEAKYYRDVQY